MLQGLGNILGGNQPGLYGTQTQSPLNLLGGTQTSNPLLGGLSNPLGGLSSPLGGLSNTLGGLSNPLGGVSNPLGALGGLGGGGGSNSLAGLLSSGLKSTQNEQRLIQEKQQRNLLKKILTQQTGDPIKSSLISSIIPGRGAGDNFDIGLGTKNSILKSLGLGNQTNLISIANNPGLLSSLVSNNNSLAGLGNSNSGGLLSSLVNLASTSNNNGNILSSLGGLGTGLLGNAGNTGSGLLGSIQSGVNTLNTLNKVSNAVNSVKGLLS